MMFPAFIFLLVPGALPGQANKYKDATDNKTGNEANEGKPA